jgi:hypothetical protein
MSEFNKIIHALESFPQWTTREKQGRKTFNYSEVAFTFDFHEEHLRISRALPTARLWLQNAAALPVLLPGFPTI